MTTLREVIARATHHEAWGELSEASCLCFENADAILAALRTALAEEPELIGELMPRTEKRAHRTDVPDAFVDRQRFLVHFARGLQREG